MMNPGRHRVAVAEVDQALANVLKAHAHSVARIREAITRPWTVDDVLGDRSDLILSDGGLGFSGFAGSIDSSGANGRRYGGATSYRLVAIGPVDPAVLPRFRVECHAWAMAILGSAPDEIYTWPGLVEVQLLMYATYHAVVGGSCIRFNHPDGVELRSLLDGLPGRP